MSDWTPLLPGFGDPPQDRTLYYGDCYDWMQRWDSESVDLIYLDPPFNSDAKYNVLFRGRGAGKAQYRAFDDTWHWNNSAAARLAIYQGATARPARAAVLGLRQMLGECGMLAYLTYMAERLEQMKRILKSTGSIYLHCDPTASHYLKLVMDAVFGAANFRNEIVWRRTFSHGSATRWGDIHDTLLFYTASEKYIWNRVEQRYDPTYVREKYRHKDARGRYQQIVMTGPGPSGGDSGKPWQGYDPTQAGRHWAVPQRGLQHLRDKGIPVPRRLHAQLDALLEQGLVYIPRKANGSTGVPRFKLYLKGGQPVQDIILDVPPINSQAAERLGYPTQKPMPLLERIIRASTNSGNLVLDPFCGCGTAVDAANRLDRRWAGIDISSFAIDLICERRMAGQQINVEGTPFSLSAAEKLAREKPFEFESWAIMRMPGFVPNTVQVADGGVDGRSTLAVKPSDHNSRLALAQVKGGRKFVLSQLRDFLHVMESKKAALGVYVTLNPVRSRDAQAQAYKAGTVTVGAEEYPRCQLWSIADYFEKRRPHLPTMNDPYNGKPLNQGELFA